MRQNFKYRTRGLLLAGLIFMVGGAGLRCALDDSVPTQSEIKNFETRDLDAPFDAVYAAATEAFFDLGYTMTHSDKTSGILVGEKRIEAQDISWWNADAEKQKTEAELYDWLQMTILVRKDDKKTSKIRIKTAIDKAPKLDKKAINEVWLYIQRQVMMEEEPEKKS